MKTLNIGWAQTSITPTRPILVSGQMYPRFTSYVHDEVTATALILENREEQYIQVSLDVVNVPIAVASRCREKIASIEGIHVDKVAFNGTHTHNSMRGIKDPHQESFKKFFGEEIIPPCVFPPDVLYGEEEAEFIAERVYEIVSLAWSSRKPGGVSFAQDYAVVGFNRRPLFSDEKGTVHSVMYGDCSKDSFIGFEGPTDHTVALMFTFDPDRNLTGVVVNVPCPSQVHELHSYISADYWTEARSHIRKELGNIPILALCGAAGDQNPLDLVRLSKTNKETLIRWNAQAGEVFRNLDMERECRDIGLRIASAVTRGFEKAKQVIHYNPIFKHSLLNLCLPIRRVSEQEYKEALLRIEQGKKGFSPDSRMTSSDMVKLFEPMGVALRWERQSREPEYGITCHVIRIADCSIATNPFELFTEYGLQIKAKSKSPMTMIIQLCDDALTYLPTHVAIAGGSYSSKPASTLMGPDQGEVLTKETLAMISRMF